jgi:hypothetical protein
LLLSVCILTTLAVPASATDQTRPSPTDDELRTWLQNMVWHHRFSLDEITQVTGMDAATLQQKLDDFGISADTRPPRPENQLLMLPYPGGRHPRIGFLDGAIDPQRETKLSVFCPWDDNSYVVVDVPEAIWSNLGLTYLAHTHIDTVWTKQGITLPQLEWRRQADGSLLMKRRLPNGIEFGTIATARSDHIEMTMWLRNGTSQPLTDLRVQNCVMLKGADGFQEQSATNTRFQNGYALAESAQGSRWIITSWTPLHRTWGNPPCPCLHSDPKFPDCAPGETQWLRGWLSFHEGDDIEAELARIENTNWKARPLYAADGNLTGQVVDAASGTVLPCRMYLQNIDTGEWYFARAISPAGSAVEYRRRVPNTTSVEMHTTLSADRFQFALPAGRYRLRVERGKEYVPEERELTIDNEPADITIQLQRFCDLADRGWYSGDIHVHRPTEELPNVVLAEDVNVAFPLTHWVRDSREIPSASGPALRPALDHIDSTHVVWPVNTEYEIFSVAGRRHTQGAVFVLNHKTPLNIPAPPVRPVAEEARRQGALLDLDKHSWNWSLMIIPTMGVDLFELTNNHHWRTQFGFPAWTIENAPTGWPEIERNDAGFTELGWTEFGLQTYYALLNCGFRMRVSGGTASGVHPVPLGHGRVYVHTGPEFSYDRWLSGLNAGHSFTTNGPLLDVRFNDELPGTTWTRDVPSNSVQVTGQIDSSVPIRSLQIIRSGEIAAKPDVKSELTTAGGYQCQFEHAVTLNGSGWIAVRCFEDRPDGKVSFAHSNPVFVDVEGHPQRPRLRDVEYFIQRMDFEIERNRDILTSEALAEYHAARDIYVKLRQSVQASSN